MDSHNWIGGDIAGLYSLAQSLSSIPEDVGGITSSLSSKVESIVGDAGWKGDAADQFSQKWTADSVTAGALAESTRAVGDTLHELASTLEAIDRALYNAAHEVAQQGVPVGPDGKPPIIATSINPSPDEQRKIQALQGYVEDYKKAMDAARDARVVAEEKLQDIYENIGPDQQSGSPLTSSQVSTIGGYIKSLYAIPASRTRDILENADEKLQVAKSNMKQARAALKEVKKSYAARGLNIPKDHDARVAHSKAAEELDKIRSEVGAAEEGTATNSLSKLMDTRIPDLPKFVGVLGPMPKYLEFTKHINALGVIGTGVGAAVDTKADVDKGDNTQHAEAVNFGSGYAGLGIGTAATVAIAGLPVELPTAAVVSAGTAVAVGSGSIIKNSFNEHWPEDIHSHGAIKGVGIGIGNTAVNSVKDVSSLFGSIYHTVAG